MTNLSRPLLAVLAALVCALAGAALPIPPATAEGVPPNGRGTAGPPYEYATELMGEELGTTLVPLVNQAMITRSPHGYLYRAGQQHTRLRITRTEDGRLRFADTRTRSFKRVAKGCRRVPVSRGVAAVCRVPSTITQRAPLLIEVWPRLGNDHVDGRTLPATFAMTVLGDGGHDRARFGAGPDFFNGFTGADRVSGGGGNDWIRSGQDDDVVRGGAGDDQIVDTDGLDVLLGGAGNDRIGGGPGDDRIEGGRGEDFLLCGTGLDDVLFDVLDRLLGC